MLILGLLSEVSISGPKSYSSVRLDSLIPNSTSTANLCKGPDLPLQSVRHGPVILVSMYVCLCVFLGFEVYIVFFFHPPVFLHQHDFSLHTCPVSVWSAQLCYLSSAPVRLPSTPALHLPHQLFRPPVFFPLISLTFFSPPHSTCTTSPCLV